MNVGMKHVVLYKNPAKLHNFKSVTKYLIFAKYHDQMFKR